MIAATDTRSRPTPPLHTPSTQPITQALVQSGLAHQRAGRLAQAESCLLAALRVDPTHAEAAYLMGILALQSGNGAGAIAYLSRVIATRAHDADALYNMGMAHVLSYQLAPAQQWFARALAVDPNHVATRLGSGNLNRLLGRVDLWLDDYRAGLASPTVSAAAFSNLLLALHSNPMLPAAEHFDLHCEWARRFAADAMRSGATQAVHTNDRSADRVLRVGFVSPGFNASVAGHFLRGPLRALAARKDVLTYLYSNSTQADWLTAELRHDSHAWRDVIALDDDELAARIRADSIDVLIDVAGHAPGNRLFAFARKPAPVQATWLDYFSTTGLAAIDYLLTDPVSTPPDSRQQFVERPLLMPAMRLCYTAPPRAPPVAPLPALASGIVTFGAFSRPDKMGPDVVAVWARVLNAVDRSRLILKSNTLRFPEVRARFEQGFTQNGIAADRIVFRTESPYADLLAEYRDVDIALDTFPYNGGATSCDALWMGVPVVALLGDSLISRQSAAVLRTIGAAQWIARDEDEYVAIAAHLAGDLPALALVRAGLRAQTAASPLCDATAFGEAMMQQLRGAWQRWCAA